VPLKIRTEKIARKGGDPIEITIRETDLGVLESESREPDLENGFYLSRAWSSHRVGGAASLYALARMPLATTSPVIGSWPTATETSAISNLACFPTAATRVSTLFLRGKSSGGGAVPYRRTSCTRCSTHRRASSRRPTTN
jgi:hypothetical protein